MSKDPSQEYYTGGKLGGKSFYPSEEGALTRGSVRRIPSLHQNGTDLYEIRSITKLDTASRKDLPRDKSMFKR